jgi:transposase InsO family protein
MTSETMNKFSPEVRDRAVRMVTSASIRRAGLVHHSDRGSQYVERLAEAGIEPSVGSVGDSYDNALAETINGLR